ncbi:uncharacterized protein DS421_2g44910 [Arachis hypogaea]|nr:uncharacterized protein DS421_2g44910 [Arachis hypogaea]
MQPQLLPCSFTLIITHPQANLTQTQLKPIAAPNERWGNREIGPREKGGGEEGDSRRRAGLHRRRRVVAVTEASRRCPTAVPRRQLLLILIANRGKRETERERESVELASRGEGLAAPSHRRRAAIDVCHRG